MLTISLGQLKNDITPKLKGTSLREVTDFYGKAAAAANRMLARIDTEETRRTQTLSQPFWDNVNDYAMVSDYKMMIDIRPQANRRHGSDFGETTAKQFSLGNQPNSFSIKWNNMVRTLQAKVLPAGNVVVMDTFDGPSSNGLWTTEGDISGLYVEPLNYIQGNGAMGMNLSGSTGAGDIINSTAAVTDLSQFLYEDASMMYVYIPIGYSNRFTSFVLRRGSSNANYVQVTINTKADGTAFTDGWNFLLFNWNQATKVGTPDNTLNTYRYFGINYTAGTTINGFLIDSWTDSMGKLYEIEYYSEYLFRTAQGVWISVPTQDSDLINISPSSYEIFKTEMMIDITEDIRFGNTREAELTDLRLMLNGQPQSRYVKDPPYHGLYADYISMYPSSAIKTITITYSFDL